MYDKDGNFIGPSKYGNAFQSAWPNMTLGQAMNQDVAGFETFPSYSGGMASYAQPSNFVASPSVGQPAGTAAGNAVANAASTAAKVANPYLGIATGVLGGIQTIGGLIGLATTKEPDKYSLTNRNKSAISEAESNAKFGLAPQQISTVKQGAREQLNTDLYNARNVGGNSASRAIFGLNRGAGLRTMNQLATADFNAMDAKRRYRDTLYSMEQGVQDRNTGLDWNIYNQKQQAYGGALRTGTQNLAGYFNLAEALKTI